jgi:hypothetical protein
MRVGFGVVVWAFVLLCLSCSDSTSPKPVPSSFELRIRVTDSTGAPLPNLCVHGWNKVPDWVAAIVGYGQSKAADFPDTLQLPDSLRFDPPHPNPFANMTIFRFATPEICAARLQLVDLEGSVMRTILDGPLPPGEHSVFWDGSPQSGASRIYQARFDVWTPARDTLLFQDSICVARYFPDPSLSMGQLGFTDEQGVITLDDRLFFPGTYAHNPIEAIDVEGSARGFFTFSDTLVITVTDTLSNAQQIYERVMTPLANDFTVIWQPLRR